MKIIISAIIIIQGLYANDSYNEFKKHFEETKPKEHEKDNSYSKFEKEHGYTSFKEKIKKTGKIPLMDDNYKISEDESMTMPN